MFSKLQRKMGEQSGRRNRMSTVDGEHPHSHSYEVDENIFFDIS
jgi:hypothetical protein